MKLRSIICANAFKIFKFALLGLVITLGPQKSFGRDESESASDSAYWDYGIGLGAVHYEHYPAADQFSDLALPAPTFQYRGKVLRADERDGAHLYLVKSNSVTLEISGVGYPALDSANNESRQGMDNLPWMLALGPQLVYRADPAFDVAFGIYQVTTTDFSMTRFQGTIFELRATYTHEFDFYRSQLKLSLSSKWASQELQALYYEVPLEKVTPQRLEFQAHEGLLSQDLTYYQSFKSGRFSFSLGTSVGIYSNAANRMSPLHKSDTNVTGFIGLNYVLGESRRSAIREEETSGLINSLRVPRGLRDSF